MGSYTPKTYYIKTFGCQANTADSNSISGLLDVLGFEPVSVEKAYKSEKDEYLDILPKTDLFIINTCSVRQKSEDKVYGIGKLIKHIKSEGLKKPFIIMSGCMVGSVTGDRQRYPFNELKQKTAWVDEYMTPSQINTLPGILKKRGLLDKTPAIAPKDFGTVKTVGVERAEDTHAYINISYGCDNFCTYCVVPYARGAELSRTKEEILNETKKLVSKGISEITLCGQNVNSWGLSKSQKFKIRSGSDQKLPFAELLKKINDIQGVEQIDFISSNPFDFTKDLIETLKLPKIKNYIHIAVQSGNNEILAKMNRRHAVEDFIKLIEMIKIARPDMEIGTDIIAGFPGETEDQFMDTVKLIKKVKFSVAFISMYSPRKGTNAEKLYKDDIPLTEKKRRHAYLTKIWQKSKKIKK